MTERLEVMPAQRVDRCLLIGDTTTVVTVPAGWLAVVVSPLLRPSAGDLVEPVRAATRTGVEGVLLLVPGSVAADLAGPLGLPVVAPDGPVVATPGGVLFTAGGTGWWRHAPGGRRMSVGPRWPAPAWQSLIPDRTPWPAPIVAHPVPAGWLLTAVEGGPAVDDLPFSVAVDPDRPRLLLDPSVTGAHLAAVLRALPPAVRRVVDLVPLGPGQGAGRSVAAAAAQSLAEPLHLVNGVPLHTPAETITAYALDTAGRPVWPEPAWLLRYLPGGLEEVVASSPPQPGLRPLDAATYALDLGWVVRLTGSGLHAVPAGAAGTATARPGGDDGPAGGRHARAGVRSRGTVTQASPDLDLGTDPTVVVARPLPVRAEPSSGYRVVVGDPGIEINDLLWPPLSSLFTALLTDIPAEVELVVAGEASAWGLAAARELAERHPGTGPTGGGGGPAADAGESANGSTDVSATGSVTSQSWPFQRAELLALPDTGSGPSLTGSAGTGRTRRMLLLAAAVLVVLLVVTGIAAAFSGRDGGDGGTGIAAGGSGPESGVPGAPGNSGHPSAGAGVSARPSASTARTSGSATPPSPGASASSGGTVVPSSGPPQRLDDGINLAAGRPASESSHTEVYGANRVTDGDPMTYWESRNNAFPQWVQVDLGTPTEVRRAVLRLPLSSAWPSRTQRVTIQGSPDGGSFATLAAESGYPFTPDNGQRATVTFAPSTVRYVRIVFTGNTVQPAGQLSVLELYRT
jgi:hypothetical protein